MTKEETLYNAIKSLDGATNKEIGDFRYKLTDDITITVRLGDNIYYVVKIDDNNDISYFDFNCNVGYYDIYNQSNKIGGQWLKQTVFNLITRL